MLKRQLLQTPIKRRALYDYIVISGWAGHDKQAIDAYENAVSPCNLPAQPLATLARSYRNEGQWSKSLDLYRKGVSRYPDRKEFNLGRIMTLADAKRNAQAIDHGQKLVSRLPQDPDSHLALA